MSRSDPEDLANVENVEEVEEDYFKLGQLSKSLNELLEGVSKRVAELSIQTQKSVEQTHRRMKKECLDPADEELKRLHAVVEMCDEIEQEFVKIRQIGEIADDFKLRVKRIEAFLT